MIIYTQNWSLSRIANGEARLRLRVRWDNGASICAFMLGYNIEPAKYQSETCRVRVNTTHGSKKIPASVINKRISLYEETVDSIMHEFDLLSVGDFRDIFNRRVADEETKTPRGFYQLFDLFIEKVGQRRMWGMAMRARMNTIKRHMYKYSPNCELHDVTDDWYAGFVSYLVKKGLKNTTIHTTIKTSKTFFQWLTEEGYYNGGAHLSFNPHLRGAKERTRQKVYLTVDELRTLYTAENLPPYMDQVRDVFCFCCFTSLRYSDVRKLRRSDIKDGKIYVVTQKTEDAIIIELNDYSKAILDKYKGYKFPDDLALPIAPMTFTNQSLRELLKSLSINEPIRSVYYVGTERKEVVRPKYELVSTHTARHTFVVNALYLGIPAEVIIKWTGHTDYKSMEPYIAIVDSIRKQQMGRFNDIFKSGTHEWDS